MGLKQFLAECLYPQAFRDAEKLRQLKSFMETDRRWLGEFQEIGAYTERMAGVFKDLDRNVGDPYEPLRWRVDQGGFRDQLRRGEHLR